MKYSNKDGRIATILSDKADADGNIAIEFIDGTTRLMNYDEFIKEYKHSPKEARNSIK